VPILAFVSVVFQKLTENKNWGQRLR